MKKSNYFPTVELMVALALLLLACTTMFLLIPSLSSEVAAAWAQAIGSILAILAAFLIASRQHASERALEVERRNLDDIRRLEAISAVLAKPNATAKLIGRALKKKTMDRLGPSIENYLLDGKSAIEALPIFDIPSAELIVYIVNIPRALQELVDTLVQARKESDYHEMIEYPAVNDLPHLINAVLEITSKADAICDDQIAIRGGQRTNPRPDQFQRPI